MIKVSVIVPVYNVDRYIEQCLKSLINQTLKEIEIIIVNDGSSDNSLDIINKFKKNDERIIVINQKNAGVSNARNVGISVSKGKYLYFIDPDDWVDEGLLEKVYLKATENQYDIIVTGYKKVSEHGILLSEIDPIFNVEGVYKKQEITDNVVRRYIGYSKMETDNAIKGDLSEMITGYIWHNLYKASLIKDNNIIFNEELRIHEDDVFNLNCFYVAEKIYKMEEKLYFYRQRDGSALNYYRKWYVENKKILYKERKKFIKLNKLDKIYFQYLDNCMFIDMMGMVTNVCKGTNKSKFKDKNNQLKEIILDSDFNRCKAQYTLPKIDYFIGIKNLLRYFVWAAIKYNNTMFINIVLSIRMRKY